MLEPLGLWDRVADHMKSQGAMSWLMLLAAIGGLGVATATEIGVRNFTTDWHAVMGYAPQPERGWRTFALLWFAMSIAPLIQGVVGAWLLSLYRRPRQWKAALAVAIVGTVPLYVAGLTLVLLPGILVVIVAFLISCSWWSVGSQELLGVAPSESPDFVAAMLIASGAALFFIAAALP